MHIFFATPAYRGIWCKQFIESLEATVDHLALLGHTTTFNLLTGSCYVQSARNELAQRFLDSGADVLFFLDDDVSWCPEDVLTLLETPGDVVAGIYPKKCQETDFPVVIHTDGDGFPLVRQDGCIAATGLPTGFMRITRVAIEQLRAAYPGQRFDDYQDGEKVGECYDLFPQGVHNGRWYGEDFAFCNLWAALGGSLWVVPDLTLTHHATDGTQYVGNYHQFLLSQPK